MNDNAQRPATVSGTTKSKKLRIFSEYKKSSASTDGRNHADPFIVDVASAAATTATTRNQTTNQEPSYQTQQKKTTTGNQSNAASTPLCCASWISNRVTSQLLVQRNKTTRLVGVMSTSISFAAARVWYPFPVICLQRLSTSPSLAESSLLSSSSELPLESMERATVGRGVLSGCLPSVYVGRSKIHGRGLFASEPLKKGTRILRIPRMVFMDALQYILLLSDVCERRIPDTMHYTHPTGVLRELVVQPHAHLLMNHSCESNVCCGQSPFFWSNNQAEAELKPPKTGTTSVSGASGGGDPSTFTRMRCFEYFSDPNSFFVTRDVQPGEELTLNYWNRFAPLHGGGDGSVAAWSTQQASRCRCGHPSCRGTLYPGRADTHGGGGGVLSGIDDEATLLTHMMLGRNDTSYTARAALLSNYFSYVQQSAQAPLPSSSQQEGEAEGAALLGGGGGAGEGAGDPLLFCRRKTTLLHSYRHVFSTLNSLAPVEPGADGVV